MPCDLDTLVHDLQHDVVTAHRLNQRKRLSGGTVCSNSTGGYSVSYRHTVLLPLRSNNPYYHSIGKSRVFHGTEISLTDLTREGRGATCCKSSACSVMPRCS